MAAAIKVSQLTKQFGQKEALSGVSFEVPEGSIFGFLGPNGAGKTTTIRCIMDFIRPSSGSVRVFGKDAHEFSTELKGMIGFLPADMQLNPKWTAADHLKLAEDVRGGWERDRLVRLLELDINSKVGHLSSGNKQKLSILLAFAGRPKLLIMDEPTRGLDPVLQNTLYDLLKDFTKQGNTVFFSSHNLSEVQRICDAVVLIKEGKVVTSQGMDEIRGANIHVITASAKKALDRAELTKRNAEVISFSRLHVALKIKGDINPLMTYLLGRGLHDLSVTHASLEDIFLEKYKESS